MEPEVIIVQSKGMDRWLSMELSRRLGVFANAQFPFPRKFIEGAFATVLGGVDEAASSFSPERMVWSIAALLPAFEQHPAFAELRGYLAGDRHGARRIELSARLADVFDQYPVYRPESVLAWEEAPSSEWQAICGAPSSSATRPARRTSRGARTTRSAPTSSSPPRPPRSPGESASSDRQPPSLFVDVFAALAQHIEIHLFLISPSRAYWAEIRDQREIARSRKESGGADEDELAHTLGNLSSPPSGASGAIFSTCSRGASTTSKTIAISTSSPP